MPIHRPGVRHRGAVRHVAGDHNGSPTRSRTAAAYRSLVPALLTLPLLAGGAVAQTSVIQQNNMSTQPDASQQNNLSINGESGSSGEGSSVTVSGRSISVDTAAAGMSRIIGNGQPASQQRPIGPVGAIRTDGAFALTVTIAATAKLTIEADSNLLPIIRTTVSDNRLEIYADRSYSTEGRIKVTVASPGITEISASGSNRIAASGFAGGPLTISLNGSNTASLSGQVASLSGVLGGANHLSAQGLSADSAKITLNGSGDAIVDARQAIAAQISGAGSVTVYGHPKSRSTEVNGAGRISFAE